MFRLALSLGCTVNELKDRISLEELLEWVAFYKLEPWGSMVDANRHAMGPYVATCLAAETTGKKGSSKKVNIKDFLVGVGDNSSRKQGQTSKDHFDILSQIAVRKK